MTIDSLETVFITCIFVAPGFIIDRIVNACSPQGKRSDGIEFLYYLIYSAIQCSVCSWIYLSLWNKYINDLPKLLFFFCVVALIGSFVIGIIIGLFKSKKWLRNLANKIHLNVGNSIPTSWDYYFSKQESSFIIVTLLDDKKIYGYYGGNSFTSSEQDERDIFIEKTYAFNDEKIWIEDKTSLGILIHQSQIKTIEFLKGEE